MIALLRLELDHRLAAAAVGSRRSMLYSSALRASRGSYMVPAQNRPAGSALPSLNRVVAASWLKCDDRLPAAPPQLRAR